MNDFNVDSVLMSDFEKQETTNYLTSQIFNNINAFVFVFDFENKVPIWINKYYETRMGYLLEELENLTSTNFMALFHPESLKIFISMMMNYTTLHSKDKRTVYKLKTKDQNWIDVMISSSVLKRDTNNQIKYLIGYGVEIFNDELNKSINEIRDLELKSLNLLILEKLSKRELEIVEHIANCMTDKEIAEKLNISIHTTKTHRKRIINKLGLKNTASLVKLAVETGLV